MHDLFAMQTPISVAPYGAGANTNISVSNFTDAEPLAASATISAAPGPASSSGAASAGAAPAFPGGPHALRLPLHHPCTSTTCRSHGVHPNAVVSLESQP